MLAENSNRPNIVRGLAVRGSDSPEPDSVVALMNFVLPVRILVPPPAIPSHVVLRYEGRPKIRPFSCIFPIGENHTPTKLGIREARRTEFSPNLSTPTNRSSTAFSGRPTTYQGSGLDLSRSTDCNKGQPIGYQPIWNLWVRLASMPTAAKFYFESPRTSPPAHTGTLEPMVSRSDVTAGTAASSYPFSAGWYRTDTEAAGL